MQKSLFALAIIYLVGCSAAFKEQPDVNSPLFLVPAGARVILQKTVNVQAGQNEIYFQNGDTMPWYKVDIYLPYCALRISSKINAAQVIQPDEFTVTKSYQETFFQQVLAPDAGPVVRPAAFIGMVDLDQGGNMEYQVVADVMKLSSERQPNVRALLCTDWGVPQNESHITLEKMRRALGNAITIDLQSSGE